MVMARVVQAKAHMHDDDDADEPDQYNDVAVTGDNIPYGDGDVCGDDDADDRWKEKVAHKLAEEYADDADDDDHGEARHCHGVVL